MMRSLVLVVPLFLAAVLQAQPVLEFTTEHTDLTDGSSAMAFIRNTSDVTAHDLVVRVEFGEGLELFNDVFAQPFQRWDCGVEARVITCRIAELAPEEFGSVSFALTSTDHVGGHRPVIATLTTRESATQTIAFDFVTPHVIPVTTADDFGAGTLRAAIEEVNANALCGSDVPCLVTFPTASSAQPLIIKPATPLPAIRKCNTRISRPIDFENNFRNKDVEISGEHATYGNGLEVRASCAAGVYGVTIENIAVHSWPWNGIYYEAPAAHADAVGAHLINQVYVGTERTGLVAKPNGSRGIITDSPHEVLAIYNSIASGNVRSGIAFFRGKDAVVAGSKLGIGRDGQAMGNGGAGIFTIGVPLLANNNIIAFNGMGIAVSKGTRQSALVFNTIYSNLGLGIDWGLDGRTVNDGATLQAPRLLSAFYDSSANVTYVHAMVYLRAGEFGNRFKIDPYISNDRGDAIERVPQFPTVINGSAEGADVAFDIGIPGDHRGQFIVMQTQAVAENIISRLSSELSLPIRVP